MARVYYDPDSSLSVRRWLPGSAVSGLPIEEIKLRLKDVQRQRLVPFLGAGASLSSRDKNIKADKPSIVRPDSAKLQQICDDFNLQDPIQRLFINAALQVAQLLRSPNSDNTDLTEAPSSWELAKLLANDLHVEPFLAIGEALMSLVEKREGDPENIVTDVRARDYIEIVKRCARLLGLQTSVPQLLAIASFHNSRDDMIGLLSNRFQNVSVTNSLHSLLAECAHDFVATRNNAIADVDDKKDFVIITTNYDCLIEKALDSAEVPACVVTVTADPTLRVVINFSPNSQRYLGLSTESFNALKKKYTEDERLTQSQVTSAPAIGNAVSPPANLVTLAPIQNAKPLALDAPKMFAPKKFQLANKTHSLAMVYKIHGSLEQRLLAPSSTDGMVISDHDYVEFIQRNGFGNDLIPAYIFSRLMESRLLFLGYSFADWNVRGLYRYFLRNRQLFKGAVDTPAAGERDFIIMRSFHDTDRLFFQNWDVSVLVVDLNRFAGSIRGE
jgi:SIR2-like domain